MKYILDCFNMADMKTKLVCIFAVTWLVFIFILVTRAVFIFAQAFPGLFALLILIVLCFLTFIITAFCVEWLQAQWHQIKSKINR